MSEKKVKTIVPNAGHPVVGKPVAWVRGLREQHLIRVHVQDVKNMTLCKALNTKDSPYIGTGGHIAFCTTAKVTCKPCSALVAKQAPPKAKKQTKPVSEPITLEEQAEAQELQSLSA